MVTHLVCFMLALPQEATSIALLWLPANGQVLRFKCEEKVNEHGHFHVTTSWRATHTIVTASKEAVTERVIEDEFRIGGSVPVNGTNNVETAIHRPTGELVSYTLETTPTFNGQVSGAVVVRHEFSFALFGRVSYPTGSVALGDAWTLHQPHGPNNRYDFTCTSSIVGSQKVLGHEAWKIKYSAEATDGKHTPSASGYIWLDSKDGSLLKEQIHILNEPVLTGEPNSADLSSIVVSDELEDEDFTITRQF